MTRGAGAGRRPPGETESEPGPPAVLWKEGCQRVCGCRRAPARGDLPQWRGVCRRRGQRTSRRNGRPLL